MDSLPDDIVVDILSWLPVKSLCCCKGVSRRWRDLICHGDYSRKFPQALPGLFYCSTDYDRCSSEARHFTNVWHGSRHPPVIPSLSVLTGCAGISIVDCCNGMLLYRFSDSSLQDNFRYIVCNPVEDTMIILPDSGCGDNERVVCLAFDPAFYPETYVFEFVYSDSRINPSNVAGANIYSPQTGTWSYKRGGWGPEPYLFDDARWVFYNGFLHLITGCNEVFVVDVEGEMWTTIPLPDDANLSFDCWTLGFIGVYKEHLCYIGLEDTDDMSIWILEDYKKDDWVKKHQVSVELLCEKEIASQYKSCYCYVVGILQGCNFILYVAGRTLMHMT